MSAARRIAAGFAASLLGLLAPALASACAACGGGTDRMRTAFLISTGFLSLLPLALIFGGLIWLRRRAGARMAGEFIDRDDVAATRARTRVVEPHSAPPLEGGEQPARG